MKYLNCLMIAGLVCILGCPKDSATIPTEIESVSEEANKEPSEPPTISSEEMVSMDSESEPGITENEDKSRPLVPSVCNTQNQGICDCSNEEGFTTYTWYVQEQQRCFTIYQPSHLSDQDLPVVISNSCYTQNNLRAGGCTAGSAMVNAANEYGFVGVCASSTDGNWEFGNDGVSNDDNPAPCSQEDSKDLLYLGGIFDTLDHLGTTGPIDSDNIFTWGFSQNAMFAAYTAICFQDKIKGFWQGGSGLYVDGVTNPLPQMEGACRRSDFLEYGRDCVTQAPCEECQYFPAYPIRSAAPIKGCVAGYEDDFLFETTEPMYEALRETGHHGRLLQFKDIGRGHSNPYNEWAWMMSCMGVVEKCTNECSDAFVDCMNDLGGQSELERLNDYEVCYAQGTYPNLAGCSSGCAATIEMLSTVESPCVVDGICQASETNLNCPLDCEEELPVVEDADDMVGSEESAEVVVREDGYGADYVDYFSAANSERWKQQGKAAVHCNDVCYERDPDLVFYDFELDGSGGQRGLQLKMQQSDCYQCCNQPNFAESCLGLSCCDGEDCSKFKAGHLRTRNSYGYGKFEAYLRTGGIGIDGTAVSTKTCFTPIFTYNTWDEIALCFDSETPHLANFSRWAESTTGSRSMRRIQRDVSAYTDAIVDFNHATQYHRYTVHWYPDKIEWYIDGILMKINDTAIPSIPGETILIVRPTDSDVYTGDAALNVAYVSYEAFECGVDYDCN